MSSKDILEQALELKPDERFMVVEGLIKSLDEVDSSLEKTWTDESEKRLKAFHAGELEGMSVEEMFKKVIMDVVFSKIAKQELDDVNHYYDIEFQGLGKRF